MIEADDRDPRKAIGAIIAELIAAGCEYQNGSAAGMQRRLKRVSQAVTVLRVATAAKP